MYKVGDKIKIGPMIGEISEVHCKSRIGFNCKSEVSYDILLKNVPEEDIKIKSDENTGTD
jgi:hypothetical protein